MTVTPSSQTETSGPIAGQLVFTDNNEIVTVGLAATAKIILGQFVTFDSSGNAVLATTTSTRYDGIGVACYNPNSPIGSQTATIDNTSGSAGDLSVQIAMGSTYVYTIATAAIKPLSAVGVTAGSYAVALTAAAALTSANADVNTAANAWSLVAGRYWGHSKEEKTMTAAVSNDIIAVRLGV